MTDHGSLTFKASVHFRQKRFGRKEMTQGVAPAPARVPLGRVPRISRLMALAIRFERLLACGEVSDYAELARLGHVTRARVTQIMNLLNLAPDIQEAILFLPPTATGRDAIKEWQLRPIAAMDEWGEQRIAWRRMAILNATRTEQARGNRLQKTDSAPRGRSASSQRSRARHPAL